MAWLLAAVPLAGSAGVLTAGRSRRGMVAWAVGSMIVLLGVSMAAAGSEWVGSIPWGPRLGLTLSVEGLSRLMVVLVPAIAAPVVAYAASYHSRDPSLGRLLALMVGFVGAMEVLVAAADLLTLLVGWELVSVCSWALIAHRWSEARAARAATEAFVVTAFGALGLYAASGAAFASTGSLGFRQLGAARGAALDVIAAGVLLAAGAKSAQVPFSPWLFAAMEGPTPVSALLHSATMVAAGAYALGRLVPVLASASWLSPTVAAVGMTTALVAGLVALLQTDLKRALAGSTSAQFGLVLVAVAAGSTFAAGAHLAAHAAFKALLFLGAGMALHAAGTGDLTRLRLGRSLRGVTVMFGVATLALAAVPPLGGAFSKEQIVAAAAQAWPWATGAVLLGGLLSATYAGRLFILAFGPGRPSSRVRVPRPELGAMALLAGISILLGAMWVPAGREAIADLIGARPAGTAAWEIAATVGTVAAGFGMVIWLDRRVNLASFGLTPAVRIPAAEWMGLPVLGRRLVVQPLLAVAVAAARFDDRVVDAGIRAVGRIGDAFSGILAWWGERGVDGAIEGVGWSTMAGARGSRIADERGVDGLVEGLARGVGVAGAISRKLQSGMAHRTYVTVAVGVVVVVAVLLLR